MAAFVQDKAAGVVGSSILALDDAGLAKFINDKRPTDGSRVDIDLIDVLKDLSKEERDRFLQRVVNAARSPQSVDLDLVSAKLLQLGDRDADLPRTPSPEAPQRPTTPPPVTDDQQREIEKQYYSDLIADGGRPWFPLEMFDDVSRNPEKYRDSVLSFWVLFGTSIWSSWHVYSNQYMRWTSFRVWQLNNREPTDMRPIYDMETERCGILYFTRQGATRSLERVIRDADKDFPDWEEKTKLKRDGDGSFDGYIENVKGRLRYRDVTIPPTFALKKDVQQQDKLTTWLEYLSYEYYEYESLKHSKREFHYQRARIRWILDQLPFVEEEFKKELEEAAKNGTEKANALQGEPEHQRDRKVKGPAAKSSRKRKQSHDGDDLGDTREPETSPRASKRRSLARSTGSSNKGENETPATPASPEQAPAASVPTEKPPPRASRRRNNQPKAAGKAKLSGGAKTRSAAVLQAVPRDAPQPGPRRSSRLAAKRASQEQQAEKEEAEKKQPAASTAGQGRARKPRVPDGPAPTVPPAKRQTGSRRAKQTQTPAKRETMKVAKRATKKTEQTKRAAKGGTRQTKQAKRAS